MAVYTNIKKSCIDTFLKSYNLGKLLKYEGILEGVENTNFKITTTTGIYILTIFEKRVDKKDLPFFINLQKYLFNKKIRCPKPISNKNGIYINKIKNKNCVIMSFLKGKKTKRIQSIHCHQVGKELGKMHLKTNYFKLNRKNSLNQSNWNKIFKKCKKSKKKKYSDKYNNIENELIILEKNWPKKLPKGVIHADLFQDNVFFIKNSLSGFIDYYFACNDFYVYELAICINAWCFDKKIKFDKKKCRSLIKGYQNFRKLSKNEIKNLNILLRGAAMRFFLTRLHDELYHPKEAFVKPKDPLEYYNILEFHQKNKSIIN